MNFDNPGLLMSGLFIGLLGIAMLTYGKKSQKIRCMAGGLFLCVFPYFVSSLLVLWLVTAACVGAVVMIGRQQG